LILGGPTFPEPVDALHPRTNAEKKLPTPNAIFLSNFRTPDDDDFCTDNSCMQKSKATNQYITHHSAIGRFDIPLSSVEQQISTDSLANSLSGNLFMEFAKA
jgi:hypothetical protein